LNQKNPARTLASPHLVVPTQNAQKFLVHQYALAKLDILAELPTADQNVPRMVIALPIKPVSGNDVEIHVLKYVV
jgi:hypothetical protein